MTKVNTDHIPSYLGTGFLVAGDRGDHQLDSDLVSYTTKTLQENLLNTQEKEVEAFLETYLGMSIDVLKPLLLKGRIRVKDATWVCSRAGINSVTSFAVKEKVMFTITVGMDMDILVTRYWE